MIDDAEDDHWVYRRDARIRRPVADLDGPSSTPQRPGATPEIQLLYKSLRLQDKDEANFDAVVEALHAWQRQWLGNALTTISPGHPWLERL